MHETYEHSGKPLDNAIAQELIKKHFGGQRVRTKDLKKQVEDLHIRLGGLEPDDRYKNVHPVTRALANLKRAKAATNSKRGTWQIGR